MRLDAAGVPLEVALTAGLAHPNLLATRAHTIVRFAPRSGDRTAALQRAATSLDGRPPAVPARYVAGSMAGSMAGSPALAEPAGLPVAVGSAAAMVGQVIGRGGEPAAAGTALPPLPGPVRIGADERLERAMSLSAPPAAERLERSVSGSSCSGSSWAQMSSAGLASCSAGAMGGTSTPLQDAREWDSPGVWRSLPAACHQPTCEAGGQAGGALRGNPRKEDSMATAVQRLSICDSGHGETKKPAAVEEGEVWLLLDYCNRGCLAVRLLWRLMVLVLHLGLCKGL